MTRRELFAAGAACASTLGARSHWDRNRIAAITDEIGNTADQAVVFARENGLLFVEIRNQPGANREYAASREADIQADAAHFVNEGIKVSCLDTSLLRFAWPESPAPDQARWDRRMDDLRKALRCAQILGTDKVRIFAGTRVADPSALVQRTADTIGEMALEAEKQKMTLLLENDAGTNVATCAELTLVIKLAPSKSVGICWRPCSDSYALLPKKRILNVRVPARSLIPGNPDSADWKAILLTLDRDGYAGRIGLETGVTGNTRIDTARDALDQLVHIVREVS